jgi:small subunit ribosomal protein S1
MFRPPEAGTVGVRHRVMEQVEQVLAETEKMPVVQPETSVAHVTSEPNPEPAAEQAGASDDTSSDDTSSDDAEESDDEGDDSDAETAATGEAAGEATEPGTAPKKKRKRRRKKKPAAANGEAAAGTDGAAGENADGERPHGGFRIGEEVFGHVENVTEETVWIDIVGKAHAIFDIRELGDETKPQIGDQFIATVASAGIRGGMLVLSRTPFDLEATKTLIQEALANASTVEGLVTGAVKGGLEVDLGGVRAFAPASHVDLRHGASLEHLVGRRFQFNVISYARKGRDVVVSRKVALEAEAKEKRAEVLKQVEVGKHYQAVVRKLVAWGVFAALPEAENVEGLIPLMEVSHRRGERLADVFKPGETIEVVVQRIDDNGKLWLSRKAAIPDPWSEIPAKFPIWSRHEGKVVRVLPFGAFIELESGVEGLCHVGDMSVKRVEDPKEVVKEGESIAVVISHIDPKERRIGLHIAPPEDEANEPRQKVKPHAQLKVKVVEATPAGVLVRVVGNTGRHARGFIPAAHTGKPRTAELRKEFPVGTQLEVKVTEAEARDGGCTVSIRALTQDTERNAYNSYREGVKRDAKFGTLGDLFANALKKK